MTKKLRIAQITNLQESVPPIHENGLEQIVYLLTQELVKRGHEVTLFATADSKTSAKLVPIWPTAVSRDPAAAIFSPDTFSQWAVSEAFLRQADFDIIHDHTWSSSRHFAGLINIPVVATVHSPITRKETLEKLPADHRPYFERILARNEHNSHAVMVSRFQASRYPYPTTVIPNGIDVENFHFNPSGGDYLLFLGYITPNKGALQAIEAVLPTKEKLIIAGPIRPDDPVAQKYFAEKIKPLLSDRIKYVGPANKPAKIKLLAGAKATLMPIQWDEPFGLVTIESLAAGTPVIALNRAAMPEIISSGQDGFLANSVEEITDFISQIENIDRAKCRQKAEQQFSAAAMVEKYEQLYRHLLH
ncbi:MAG: glycosyltransferase family 4 protein [Patescibacteria group bacterium]|nr:glycosyltransferase family 4 protein [Patescibacteria group bacterium]